MTFTNRLSLETSPYLLQHAHNPVDWYPWGEEAFERAKAEDKPVLVSIGYSACHWCHVMEHESFEDERTAAIMNENFVNIKVDMEERPDVDQIYMNFVQLTTGRGGWPMNVFLMPDKRPFFGGTYFPPSPRYGMASWGQILMSISEAYRHKRDEIERSTIDILGELRRMSIVEPVDAALNTDLLDAAFLSFSRNFDSVNGGFGGAPKFPPAMSLEFLLRYHKRTGDDRALAIVEHTLAKMACGGIYDQLGGGFHRYSVDAVWLVPHFEKMLYDNAQLVRVYLHAYQVLSAPRAVAGGSQGSGNQNSNLQPPATAGGTDKRDSNAAVFFKRIAIETLEYIRREMLDGSGGFYSTQDADSEGEEGKFFVWTPEEIEGVLGAEAAEQFCARYDVTVEGNFEGKNILNLNATERNDAILEAPVTIVPGTDIRKKLFDHREKRIKPGRDEKVLTAWNGLMMAAFADAAAVLNDPEYLEIAKRNADFIAREMTQEGRLLRTWKQGKAKLNAYVEDYANVIDGLLVLFQTCGGAKYLIEAKRLADDMILEFWDEERGGFFFTSNDHEELIVRNKDFYDNATPSGNSVAADVLMRLAKLYGDEKYERFGVAVLRLAASQIRRHPQGFGRALSAMEFHLSATKEIVLVGEPGSEVGREIYSKYLPDAVIVQKTGSTSPDLPLLDGREPVGGNATVYVCENFVCKRPVTEVNDLRPLLSS